MMLRLLPLLVLFQFASPLHCQDKGEGDGALFITGVTIHPATGADPFVGSILVRDGVIAEVGEKPVAPAGVRVIDGKGLWHVAPGMIDCHSHIAISGGVNEATEPVTPEVRMLDSIDHEDETIYRALAGGTTMAHLLHGSANVIGGQDAVIKLRWGASPDGLVYTRAPKGVKFALGENPKKSNMGGFGGGPSAYPSTRMGVEQILRRSFTDARNYEKEWKHYGESLAAGKRSTPPRRDLRLEALVDILNGEIKVHCHCYRADEILMLLRVADDFGIRIQTLQHVLEGYKVAREIAAHGAGASTFSDWWAYKLEAYDATPYNAELMRRAGVLVSLNSDSADLIRRLNLEAAKCVKYGGYPENLALGLVTLNPARQLGIDKWVGSIEVGKDGDLAIYNAPPLDSSARCLYTIIEGRVFFDREKDLTKRAGLDTRLAATEGGER